MLTARLAPLSSQISEYISITWLHHGMHSSCLNSCSSARICPGGCFPSSDLIYTGVTCLKVYLLFFREWEENLLPCHQWSNTSSTETSRSYSTWLKKRKVSYHLPTLQSQAAGLERFVSLQMLPELSNQLNPRHFQHPLACTLSQEPLLLILQYV